MQLEYNSDWISPSVEFIKCLEDADKPTVNEETVSLDYVLDDEDNKELFRAIIDENINPVPMYIETIRAILEELEEENYTCKKNSIDLL
jgi:hypothetical protein